MSRAEPYTAEVTVEKYLGGVRIDSFLVKHFRNYTSWRIQRMVRAGQVRIDGEVVTPERRVRRGQRVAVRLIEPPDKLISPEPLPFGVVYEDEWLLLIDKPPGLIAHPTGEYPTGSLANAVQHYLDETCGRRGLLRPGIVHRLDRDTSGIIAVTKDHLSHRLLSIQFQTERVSKSYLALVEGAVKEDSGVIDLPIGRSHIRDCALMSARADAREARKARTLFEVVERYSRHTLVRAKPRTGRLHQIRVHLATIGHPIVGDEFYDAFGVIKPPRRKPTADNPQPQPPASPLIPRQALHASTLAFAHPITQEWTEFTAPLPKDMQRALEAVRS